MNKKTIEQILKEIRDDCFKGILFDEAYFWLDKRIPQIDLIRRILKKEFGGFGI